MFKKIPGTTEYRINLKKEIIDSFGIPCNFTEDRQGMIKIELFGKIKKVKLQWLSLLAWYECGDINNLEQHLDKIRFYPAWRDLKIRCGNIMQFTEPIYFKEGFRYIPSFPRYAIDISCTIIDTLTNECVSFRYEQGGYSHVYLRNPDRNANKHTRLHRFLALAWLPNNDFVNRPIVNHRNGIRDDNALTNLEWCSYSENSVHALITGLNNTSVMMKSRDIVSGTVEIYRSAAELAKKLGFSRGYSSVSFTDRLPGFLYKNRYEIKKFDDDSPWYYEKNTYDPEKPRKQYFTITVLNKQNGEIETFTNTREFHRAYGSVGTPGIEATIAKIADSNKDLDITYRRNALSGPYRILNIENGEIKIVNSLKEICEHITTSENEIGLDLRRGLKYIYSHKWIVATGIDEINLKEYKDKPKPYFKVEIIDERDGTIVTANSIKDASRITGVTPRTIDIRLKDGKATKCLRFRPLE